MTVVGNDQLRYQLRDLLGYQLRDQEHRRQIAAFRLAGAGSRRLTFSDISICGDLG
jgi:hypothetical protein